MALNLASILARPAAATPGKTAVIAEGESLDYATVDTFARMFAGAIQELGVAPGETVALLLPNVPHFTVACFGCHYAGNPAVPLNVLSSEDELAYLLGDSDAVAVVVWELFAAKAVEAARRVEKVRHVIVGKADLQDVSAPDGCLNFTAVVAGATPRAEPHPTADDDTAIILYTSGTTGRPKGAELTHANLASNARVLGEVVSLEPETVSLVTLPLFHAFGMTVMHNAVLTVGGTMVMLPRFHPETAMRLMAEHQVTFFGGVPAMYAAMLKVEGVTAADLSALKWCVSGAAPMPAGVIEAFESRFRVVILEGYGLSETSPVVCFNMPGRPRTPGTIGYPVPGMEIALFDEGGQAVTEPETPGEMCVRGDGVMKGYWNNPEATAEAVVDGWFHTGDIAVFDTNGAFRLVDRKKDIINRSGYKVYPREVEDVLYGHPAVAQAAVIGVPDDVHGEEVRAFVSLEPGSAVEPSELVVYCRERLSAYKYPRHVEILESLPTNVTGKVLRRELKAAEGE